MECGPQCAGINLMKMMQVLSADSLDTTLKVHLIKYSLMNNVSICWNPLIHVCIHFVSFASQALCIKI